jgi:hypothetical protein
VLTRIKDNKGNFFVFFGRGTAKVLPGYNAVSLVTQFLMFQDERRGLIVKAQHVQEEYFLDI